MSKLKTNKVQSYCENFITFSLECFHDVINDLLLVSAILAIDDSKGFVYAYYVLRIISHIMSQGSIFCISAAYAVRFYPGSRL